MSDISQETIERLKQELEVQKKENERLLLTYKYFELQYNEELTNQQKQWLDNNWKDIQKDFCDEIITRIESSIEEDSEDSED